MGKKKCSKKNSTFLRGTETSEHKIWRSQFLERGQLLLRLQGRAQLPAPEGLPASGGTMRTAAKRCSGSGWMGTDTRRRGVKSRAPWECWLLASCRVTLERGLPGHAELTLAWGLRRGQPAPTAPSASSQGRPHPVPVLSPITRATWPALCHTQSAGELTAGWKTHVKETSWVPASYNPLNKRKSSSECHHSPAERPLRLCLSSILLEPDTQTWDKGNLKWNWI